MQRNIWLAGNKLFEIPGAFEESLSGEGVVISELFLIQYNEQRSVVLIKNNWSHKNRKLNDMHYCTYVVFGAKGIVGVVTSICFNNACIAQTFLMN